MAETIGPDGRKTFIASLERAQVKNNGDRAEYVRQLQAAARQGNPWARARYGHYKQEEMRAEFERGREAEQSSQGWNEAAYYTDTFGTCATLGANHSLQRMADKAMRGDTEGTLTELGTASLQVVTAAGAARRAVAVGKVAWARGVRLFRGGPASGTATTAVEAGGAAPAAPRPALQSVPRPPRSAARAEPPVPAPARSAP
ncbi:MAG: hypothetical protein FJX76_24870, partial [Armatimonadetes bacterium]|nr:hypothetical protein [Armatimonadota bacterium]